jgi:hypothetical protein
MPRTEQLTKDDFIKIGQRYPSTDVLREARAAAKRWNNDLPLLKRWAWGKNKLNELEALINNLDKQQKIYSAQVGTKLAAVPTEAALTQKLRTWSLRALSILNTHMKTNVTVAKAVEGLGSQVPTEPGLLTTYAGGLYQIIETEKSALTGDDKEAADDEFFKEGTQLITDLPDAGSTKIERRDTKEVGTSDLDELDGRIYDLLRDLNENARRAHREAGNTRRASQYVFYYLTTNPTEPTEEEAPVTTPTPGTPTTDTPKA